MDHNTVSINNIFKNINDLENQYNQQKTNLREADSIANALLNELDECKSTLQSQQSRIQDLIQQIALVKVAAAVVNPTLLHEDVQASFSPTSPVTMDSQEALVDVVSSHHGASMDNARTDSGAALSQESISQRVTHSAPGKIGGNSREPRQAQHGAIVRQVHQLSVACNDAAARDRKHSLMLGARMVAISKALQAKAQLREVLTVAANKANELEAQLQERYAREIDPFGITPQKCLPDQQDGSFHFRWKPESANTVERSSLSHDVNPEALLEGAFPLNRRACELAVKRLFLTKLAAVKQWQASDNAGTASATDAACDCLTLMKNDTYPVPNVTERPTLTGKPQETETLSVNPKQSAVVELLQRHRASILGACLCKWERAEKQLLHETSALHQAFVRKRTHLRREMEDEAKMRERELMLLERDLEVVRDRVAVAELELRNMRGRK